MANPSYYNQTEAVQRTVSQLIREEYMTEIPELIWKVGSPTMRLLQPGSEIANAENQGINQRVITARANSGRATRTLLADFQRGRTSSAASLKLRYNYNDASANDFVSIEAATSVPWHDFTTSGNDVAAQVLDRAQQDVMDSIEYTTNVLMHSDQTGRIGQINGSLRDEFDVEGTYAGANTPHTTGATSASFLVDGHTIGIFREGVHLDIYNGGTLLADEVRIDRVNFEEGSLTVYLSELSTVANLDDLDDNADNADIYLAGTKDAGFKCAFAEMFKTSYTSDSWIGGIDRSAQGNRHWQPIRTRATSASMPMQKSYLDNAAQAIGFRTAEMDMEAPVFLAGTKIVDNFRSDVGEAALSTEGVNDRGSYTIGEVALAYQHPVMGRINIMGDYTAKNDRAYLLFPEDLTMYYANMVGPIVMSEGTAGRGFERVEGANPNSGGSKFYKLEVMEQKTPFFKAINRAVAMFNVS